MWNSYFAVVTLGRRDLQGCCKVAEGSLRER
jgi:hypothetical protein